MEELATKNPAINEDDDVLTAHDVGRLGDVCPATVRYWEKTGKLPAIRTVGNGTRLFRRGDVNRLLETRKAR